MNEWIREVFSPLGIFVVVMTESHTLDYGLPEVAYFVVAPVGHR